MSSARSAWDEAPVLELLQDAPLGLVQDFGLGRPGAGGGRVSSCPRTRWAGLGRREGGEGRLRGGNTGSHFTFQEQSTGCPRRLQSRRASASPGPPSGRPSTPAAEGSRAPRSLMASARLPNAAPAGGPSPAHTRSCPSSRTSRTSTPPGARTGAVGSSSCGFPSARAVSVVLPGGKHRLGCRNQSKPRSKAKGKVRGQRYFGPTSPRKGVLVKVSRLRPAA